MQKDGYILVADYQFSDYVKAFWAIDSTGLPIDGPLWFVRDLFVTSVLLTPIIYWGVKYLKWVFVCIVTLCFFKHWAIPFAGFSIACMFYFTLGAYCSLKKWNLGAECSKKTSMICGIAMLLSFALCQVAHVKGWEIPYINETYHIVFAICIFAWLGQYVRKDKLKLLAVLSGSSFFIYAIHKPIQVIVRRCVFSFASPSDQTLLTVMLVAVPLLITFVSIGIYCFVKKYMPYLKFLNGFRS